MLENNPSFLNFFREFIDKFIENIPMMQEGIITVVDSVFAPKQIFKQLLIAIALQSGIFGVDFLLSCGGRIKSMLSSHASQIRTITDKMENAKTYLEWKRLAHHLDKLNGHDIWRKDDESYFYNASAIKKRIRDIRHMMEERDVFNLMFRLRGGLSREQFGVQHEGLFSLSNAGTKYLVEDYHKTVSDALTFICDTPDPHVCTYIIILYYVYYKCKCEIIDHYLFLHDTYMCTLLYIYLMYSHVIYFTYGDTKSLTLHHSLTLRFLGMQN